MYARVTSFRGEPGYIDGGSNYIRENVLPNVGPEEGLEGFYHLVDRESGKAISITLWASEEAMHDIAEEANQLRGEIAKAASATVEDVETYEVAISPPGQRYS